MRSRPWIPVTLLACTVVHDIAAAGDMDLGNIARRADVIVLGRCLATDSHWDGDGRVIVTDVTFTVERSFKGDVARQIDVRTLGGRVGEIGMGASQGSFFAPGARMVALLRRSRFGPYFVIAAPQGSALAVTDGVSGAQVAVGSHLIQVDELARRLAGNEP